MRKSRRLSLFLAAVLIIALAPAAHAVAPSCADMVFEDFDTDDTFTIPPHVGDIAIFVWGAGGGGGGDGGDSSVGGDGGEGGYMNATFDIAKGEVLTIVVGKGGEGGACSIKTYGTKSEAGEGGGGGGHSEVLHGAEILVVAGGGGGGGGGATGSHCGDHENGGEGGDGGRMGHHSGYDGGSPKSSGSSYVTGGRGATEDQPGIGGTAYGDNDGHSGTGADGGEGGAEDDASGPSGGHPTGGDGGGTGMDSYKYLPGGGGGGGGRRGGGGGGAPDDVDWIGGGGGGGGSSYLHPVAGVWECPYWQIEPALGTGDPGEGGFKQGEGNHRDGEAGGDGYVKIGWIPMPDPGGEGKITVTVVKTDDGDVSGIPVSFGGDLTATVHTNASGVAKVSGLWAGDYTADADDSGYTSNGPKSVTLDDDDDVASVTITLTPIPPAPPEPGPGAIEGKAEDGTTMAAMPGVLVKLLDSTDTIIGLDMTDPAGEFGFDGLEPGSYTVRGTLDGFGADTEVAVVVHDETTEVTLQLAAVIVVPPTPPAEEPIVTPPDLPKTGSWFAGLLILGGALVSAGLFGRRKS